MELQSFEVSVQENNNGTTKSLSAHRARITNCCNVFEVVMLVLLVAMAWGLATLPVIFFHFPLAENDNEVSVGSKVLNGSAACSSAFPYSGVCKQPLAEALLAANCMLDLGEDILVMQNNESAASDLINGLSLLNPSAACLEAVRPFLCLYLFGLCDKSGVSIKPTIHQCEEIRDSVCAREWALAQGLGAPLPRCEIFSDESAVCPIQNGSGYADGDAGGDMSPTEMLECREGFFREDSSGICLPSCFTFLQYPKNVSFIIDIVVCISAAIGLLSALAVLVISLIRFKRMCTFPSVLVVYMTVGMLVLSFLVIVNYTDRNALFCSSISLLDSLIEVTPFCVISGMVFAYVLLQWAVWWLFHLAILFWKVVFPFHSRKFEMNHGRKKIHIASVIIGLVVPLTPIITSVSVYTVDYKDSIAATQNVSFLAGGLGFRSTRFPPLFCRGGDRDAVFYSLVLPITIISAVGFLFLVIILRVIRKQHGLFRNKSRKGYFNISTAERKLLLIFWYYILLSAVALVTFTINISTLDLAAERYLQYFTCEQSGHDPERPCDRSGFEALSWPVLSTLSFVLLGLYPAVNLVYAIDIQELKAKCSSKKRRNEPSTARSTFRTSTKRSIAYTSFE